MRFINVLIGATGVILVYNAFFFQVDWGIAFGLAVFLLQIFFFLVREKESRFVRLGLLFSVLSAVFGFSFGFRANEVVQLLDLVYALFFSFVALYFYKATSGFPFSVFSFLMTPFVIFGNVLSVFLGKWNIDEKGLLGKIPKGVAYSLFKGVVIAVPVFMVLLFLLLHADPVFEKLFVRFTFQFRERVIVSIILFLACILTGLMKIVHSLKAVQNTKSVSVGKEYELGVILVSVVLLLGVFIGVEFQYLFSSVGERQLHQLGIQSLTYSEYVRKGFFELLIASGIVGVVIGYVLKFLHGLEGKRRLFIQWFLGLLTVESFFVLASAGKRLFLYASEHGLTRFRILGLVFLVWLGCLFLLLLVRIARELPSKFFSFSVLALSIVCMLSINLVNIDGLIATVYRPTVNGEVDYYYLTNLSSDGVASWRPALQESEKIISELEEKDILTVEDARRLYWSRLSLLGVRQHVLDLEEKFGSDGELNKLYKSSGMPLLSTEYLIELRQKRGWQAFVWGDYEAYKVVRSNEKLFFGIEKLLSRVDKIDRKISEGVRNQGMYDDRGVGRSLFW